MDAVTSSHALIERIQRGDREALSSLFEKHRRRLAVLVHYRLPAHLRPAVEVDDVLQETFLRACRQIDTFDYRAPGSVAQWLARIAQNVIIDEARFQGRRKRRPGTMVPLKSVSHPSGAEPQISETPSRALARQEWFRDLLERLESLPDHYRDVLLAAKFEGLTTAELAERLGKTREATALLLHRALRKLRDVMRSRG